MAIKNILFLFIYNYIFLKHLIDQFNVISNSIRLYFQVYLLY